MSEADSELRRLLDNPAFPRSRAYEPRWVLDNLMGPNVLWLAEALSHVLELKPGMRVLDLGCGRALSSIFLAREFGVQMWAADLWIKPTENWHRVIERGVADRVFPVHAEAHQLPFAAGFFDAIVSLDAYHYFGTDDWYIGYITRFVAPGGRLGIVVPGLAGSWEAASNALKAHFRNWELWTFHGPAWWRGRWQRSGLVEVEHADLVPDGWRHWVQSDRASGYDQQDPAWLAALEADAGRTLGFTRVVGKVLPIAVAPHAGLP